MKSFLIICSLVFAPLFSEAGEPSAHENLPALIDLALKHNPELKSSQARWRMYVGKAKQAGSLDDPMFMFKLQSLLAREPFSFGGKDPQTAKVIGITQQLPFFGKRALKEEVARYEAESYRWTTEERKLELKRMLTEAWYQLYAVDRSLEIVEKNLRIISDFTAIAESRYAVGQGAQQDIFKAGLEKSKLLDMQISLQQQRKSIEASINYLACRPAGTPVGRSADFEIPPFPVSVDQLRELAYEKRPQLKSLINQVHKGMASHRLAQKEFWPDFNVSFEYMFREKVVNDMTNDPGYNMFSLGLTFNIPSQQEKRQAMLAESESEKEMAVEEMNGLKNSINYTISDSLAQMERRRRQAELYRGGIIPQAEQSLESALIGYRVGKVDFLTLLDGRVSLFNYEKELYESKAEYMMALARLEAAVGVELVSQGQKKSDSEGMNHVHK